MNLSRFCFVVFFFVILFVPYNSVFASSFPTIVSSSTFAGDGTFNNQQTIVLPSNIVSGNILVAIIRTSSTGFSSTVGWIPVATSTIGGGFSGIYYHITDGTEGATSTFTTSGSAVISGIIYQISGFSDIEASYVNATTTDPGILSPSWGSVNNLWIAFIDGDRGDWGVASFPTNYSDLLLAKDGSSSSGAKAVSTVSRQLAASSDDPSTFVTNGSTIGSPRAGLIVIAPIIVPFVSSNVASSVSTTSATINGSITATGGSDATESGFAWGTDSTLTTSATTTEGPQIGTSTFSHQLTGLSCNTTYYFRAYATNSAGTGFGSIQTFTTSCANSLTITSPVASSTVYGNVTVTATGFSVNGIAGITFYSDGNIIGSEDIFSPYSVSLNTDTILQGTVTLTAVLRDNVGGYATTTINVIKAGCDCGSTDSSNICTGKSISVTVPGGTPKGVGVAVDGTYSWGFNSGGNNAYCGQFASGDYWVAPALGQSTVTVTSITSNGITTADVDPTVESIGLLSGANNYGNHNDAENIIPLLPQSFTGINSIVAAIQRDEFNVAQHCGTPAIEGECVDSYNVLTVLSSTPALAGSETIRPNITGQTKQLLSFSDFDFSRLPSKSFLTGTNSSGFQSIINRWTHNTEVFGLGSSLDGGNTVHGYSEGGRAFRAEQIVHEYGSGMAVNFDDDLMTLFSDQNTIDEKKPALAAMLSFGLDIYHSKYDAPPGIDRYWLTGAGQHSGRFLPAVFFAALATDSTYADTLKTVSEHINDNIYNGPPELAQDHPGPNGYVWGDSNDIEEPGYWDSLFKTQCYDGATDPAGLCANTGLWPGTKTGRDPYGYIDGPANGPGRAYMPINVGIQRALAGIMSLFPQVRQIVNDDGIVNFVERVASHGVQTGNDPCVTPDTREDLALCSPYAGTGCLYYGITWGPDSANPGQCIKTPTPPYTKVGRFSAIDGTPVSTAYTTSQVESNWATIMALFNVSPPSMTTYTTSEVAATTATMNGMVANTGGADVTQSGFIWGTVASLSGGGTATTTDGYQYNAISYTHSLTGLTCGTTYYVRAYATNSAGTGYGSVVPFTTSLCTEAPSYPAIVSSVSFGSDGSYNTSSTITLPSGIVVGNRLVAILRTGSNVTITPTAGWTAVATSSVGDAYSGIYSRIADGSEGSTTTFTTNLSSNTPGVVYQISGSSGIEANYTTTNTVDPATLSPSWGSANTLWIALVDGNKGNWGVTFPPTSYTNLMTGGKDGSTSSGASEVNTVTRRLAASSDDPSTFITVSSPSNPRAGLIAIRPANVIPIVVTSSASSISTTTVTLNGNVVATNGANVTVSGFAYGTDATLATVIATTTTSGAFSSAPSAFTTSISSLNCNTTYYARAYAINSVGTGFGAIVPFTTSACVDSTPPSVPSGLVLNSVSTSSLILSWASSTDNVLVANYRIYRNNIFATTTTAITYTDRGLIPSTLYSYNVSAVDNSSNPSATSTTVSTTTLTVPDITPPIISSVASSTATSTATITWNTNESSTSTVNYGLTVSYGTSSTSPSLVTSHSILLSGLTPSTTYHFKLSSTDISNNIASTTDYTFTTTASGVSSSTPIVTTQVASSVTQTTVTLGGVITATGTTNVTEEGVLYGLTTNYTATSSATSSSFSTGSYTRNVTGLTCATTYHYIAFAINSIGVSYGTDSTFTTSACPAAVSSGGGGGSSYIPYIPPVVTPLQASNTPQSINTLPSSLQQKSIVSKNAITTIPLGLKISNTGNTVAILQDFLAAKGFIPVITTAKGIFGPVTQNGLKKYQKSVGLEPVGYIGKQTKAKIDTELAKGILISSVSLPVVVQQPIVTSSKPKVNTSVTQTKPVSTVLTLGSKGSVVKEVQTILSEQTSYLIPSDVNGIYGDKTVKAVKYFQCLNKIVCSGLPSTTGWGTVGPKTLKVLRGVNGG